MPSILEKAKKSKILDVDSPDQVDAALEWLRGAIGGGQLARGLNMPRHQIYAWLPPRLKAAYQQGKLVIK